MSASSNLDRAIFLVGQIVATVLSPPVSDTEMVDQIIDLLDEAELLSDRQLSELRERRKVPR